MWDCHGNRLSALRYYVRYKIAASTISKVGGASGQVVFSAVLKKKNTFFPFKVKENQTSVFDTTVAWRSDSYLAMGILGFGFYVLLGITSLPSVSNALSWREFSFVQVAFIAKSSSL